MFLLFLIFYKNENLIVGDAKQSIYRFKNGLAEQFVALPALYNPEKDSKTERLSQYFVEMGSKEALQSNYRSFKNIVQFNNCFFKIIKNEISEEHKDFYNDVFQEPKGNDGGYVEIISKEELEDSKTVCLDQLVTWVDQLINEGYDCGDICILGNTKKECNNWAIELSKKYKVVSDDSLLVNSDHFVKLAIAFLKWRINPKGELESKRFAELYFSCFSNQNKFDQSNYWKSYSNKENKKVTYFDSLHFIRDVFGSEENFYFKYDSLYMLIQGFYKKMKLEELANTYLHHLADMMHNFDVLFGPNLELFIEDYEKNGKKSAIQIPENKDALKIMTGHKSKGLEFPVVILPNVDFSINSTKAKYLLEDNGYFIYTGLSNSSPVRSIKAFSLLEKGQNFIDKLNLCYVMMTRPVERLYIGNFFQKNNFGKIIDQTMKSITANFWTSESDSNVFIFGEKKIIDSKSPELGNSNNFIPDDYSDHLWFPDISLNTDILSNESDLNEARRYGNQLHNLLSEINSSSEICSKTNLFLEEGKIEFKFKEQFEKDLNNIFSNSVFRELLENAQKISNEQTILIGPNEAKRPDKIIFKEDETIVIDFKTGLVNVKNSKQVSLYKKVLKEMNFPNVKGYLFYTKELKLEEV